MHRIDGPAAAPGGFFTEGDPAVGTPATVVTDDWMNAVQGEIESVVVGGGLALAKPDNAQMLKAIRALIAAATPAGLVAPFAGTVAPSGWLACDGSAVLRSAYPALWAAIGTTYGAGDGATTFALPDLRGEFVRGADVGRGVDAGRVVGSAQAGQVARHKHVMAWGEGEVGASPPPFGRTSSASHFGHGSTVDTNNWMFHTNDGSDFDGPVNAAGLVGAETRPRNVALLFCVKV